MPTVFPLERTAPPAPSRPASTTRWNLVLALLLLAGAVARIPLVLAGGRFLIGDEGRYLRGHFAYHDLLHGDWARVAATFRHSDNIGFDVVSLTLTAIQHVVSGFFSPHGWSVTPARLNESFVLGAILLAMAPVVSIGLIYVVARRLGAEEREALCGAFLLSLSNTAFYFSRHLVPYDTAIAVALLALLASTGNRGVKGSLLAGLLAGTAFHIYNGYWFLIPLIIAARWQRSGSLCTGLPMATVATAGAAVAIALPYGIGWWAYGPAFANSIVGYGNSIVQGVYQEGWSLPWEYLWHTEGVFGALVLALPLGVLVWRRRDPIPARVRGLLWCAAGLYATWVLVSTVGHIFVLNARTIKPLVPLLCLLGGWALATCWPLSAARTAIGAGALVALALVNLLPNYWLVFPREFEASVLAKVGSPKVALSVAGGHLDRTHPNTTAPDYLMVNGQYLYPIRSPLTVPAGETVLSAAHALQHLPYQYDGFTPRQRSILRTTDIRMRLIRLADPAATPDTPPIALQATDADWPDGFDSEAKLGAR